MYKLNEKEKTQILCVLNDFILCTKSFKKIKRIENIFLQNFFWRMDCFLHYAKYRD